MAKNLETLSTHLSDICFFLGTQFHSQRAYPEAEFWYKKVIDMKPDYLDAQEALMYATMSQRKFVDAIPYCSYVGKWAPTDERKDMAIYNRGLLNLNLGNYKEGFADYDTRMRMGKTVDTLRTKLQNSERPLWDGKPCDHLLVYGEQGMGDLFMFSRYITVLQKSGLAKKITFEVPADMTSFMKYNFEKDNVTVTSQTDDITPSNEHILLVSLARIFETTLDTIPEVDVSYLKAEPEFVEKWKFIRDLSGHKIGLCWAGRLNDTASMQVAEWNSRRSIALESLKPVFDGLKHTTIVSLQKGDTDQLKDFPEIRDFTKDLNSWSDTAGIIANLDTILSIDSGPVHLAGAMGKRTLLLNHLFTCWRWNLTGSKAPWYSSVQVIRQRQEGNWDPVMEELYDRLLELDK